MRLSVSTSSRQTGRSRTSQAVPTLEETRSQGRYVLTTVSPELGWVKGLHCYYAVSRGTRCPPFTGPQRRLFTNFLQCNKRLPQIETSLLGASSVCPGEPFAGRHQKNAIELLCVCDAVNGGRIAVCILATNHRSGNRAPIGFADAGQRLEWLYLLFASCTRCSPQKRGWNSQTRTHLRTLCTSNVSSERTRE